MDRFCLLVANPIQLSDFDLLGEEISDNWIADSWTLKRFLFDSIVAIGPIAKVKYLGVPNKSGEDERSSPTFGWLLTDRERRARLLGSLREHYHDSLLL
jgi:hypothetical protein